jgi:AcrR family transcriptional regulator
MPAPSHHPTRERLVVTVAAMLDEVPPEKLLVDDILLRSGVSKGSMYYHFEDVGHLLDVAYVHRFAQHVDANIEWLAALLATTDSPESFYEGLRELTNMSQAPERAGARMERARVLGMAAHNDRLRALLAVEQQRLTDALADLVREAQAKGWITADVSARGIAVFIQAYTLGQIVNDVTDDSVPYEEWTALIDHVTRRSFTAE